MIDTHAHLFRQYFPDGDLASVLERSRAAGVTAILNCATKREDLAEAVELARSEPDVFAAVGIHPHDAKQLAADRGLLDELRALAASPRVVAIGECGLDYHYDHSPRSEQRDALRAQIKLARELGLPVVLHNRESDDDMVAILEEERVGDVGGVVHAFSTSVEVARRCLDLGLHLGFGGIITFKKADEVRAALRSTPLERIVLETDSPYLTPAPHRGKRNEPAYVAKVAARAAEELDVAVDELIRQTTDNARRLFRFAPASA